MRLLCACNWLHKLCCFYWKQPKPVSLCAMYTISTSLPATYVELQCVWCMYDGKVPYTYPKEADAVLWPHLCIALGHLRLGH